MVGAAADAVAGAALGMAGTVPRGLAYPQRGALRQARGASRAREAALSAAPENGKRTAEDCSAVAPGYPLPGMASQASIWRSTSACSAGYRLPSRRTGMYGRAGMRTL